MKIILKSLEIHKFGLEILHNPTIHFSDDQNLFIGVNGSGKTTLLRILEAAINANFTELASSDFDLSYELKLQGPTPENDIQLKVKAKNQTLNKELKSPDSVQAKVAAATGTATPSTTPLFFQETQSGSFSFNLEAFSNNLSILSFASGSSGVSLSVKGKNNEIPVLITTETLFRPIALLGELKLIQQRNQPDVSMILEFSKRLPFSYSPRLSEDGSEFQQFCEKIKCDVTENSISLSRETVEKWAPNAPDKTGLFLSIFVNILSRAADWKDFKKSLEKELRIPLPERRPGMLAFGAEVDYSLVLDPLNASSISLRSRFTTNKNADGKEFLTVNGLEMNVKFKRGREVEGEKLTFGQKRFMIFMMLIQASNATPGIVDEIDNGLHPKMIECLMKELAKKQFFASSHNKLVLDYMTFDSPEDLRQKLHFCSRDAAGRITIVSLTDEQSQKIYKKTRNRVLNPSDVLLAEELW